jgi:hypothetical protein
MNKLSVVPVAAGLGVLHKCVTTNADIAPSHSAGKASFFQQSILVAAENVCLRLATHDADRTVCLSWRSVEPPTNSPNGTPTTPPSTTAAPSRQSNSSPDSPSTDHDPSARLFNEWMRAKTAVLPGRHWTSIDGCYESYTTRVTGVHSAVPLPRREFTKALYRALTTDMTTGRVKIYKRPVKIYKRPSMPIALGGFFVDGVTVEPDALVDEWFHAKTAFDPLGEAVPLAEFHRSFHNYFLPCKDADRERWVTIARAGKHGFFRLFRERLADAEKAAKVRYTGKRYIVTGLVVV